MQSDEMRKAKLIKEAIETTISVLGNEIDHEKYILFKNKDAEQEFKELKQQSIQIKNELIQEYVKLIEDYK